MLKRAIWIAGFALFLLPLCVTAEEPRWSGFMDHSGMVLRGDLPFEMAWIKPGVNWAKYRKVYVGPVETKYLLQSDEWQELGRNGDIQKDIRKLAQYTRGVFQQAFLTDPQRRYQISYSLQPSPDLLRVEMALTELTPNKIFLKAAGYVPLYGLAAKAVNQTNRSYVSMEMRLKDGRTGEVIAKLADKKSEPFTFVNVDQMSLYGFAEDRIQQWSVKLVEMLNRKPGTVVEKSSSINLKPW